MFNLSFNELKLEAKSRGIKDYKSMTKEKLLSVLSESESAEIKNSFDDERLKKIRKDLNELRGRFSNPQVKEIRKNVYNVKKPKNLSKQKIKEIEEILFKLEESLPNFKKYHFQDDFKYRNIGEIRNLFNGIAFNQSIDENYYKPIGTKSAFSGNYIDNESKVDIDRNLSP